MLFLCLLLLLIYNVAASIQFSDGGDKGDAMKI